MVKRSSSQCASGVVTRGNVLLGQIRFEAACSRRSRQFAEQLVDHHFAVRYVVQALVKVQRQAATRGS